MTEYTFKDVKNEHAKPFDQKVKEAKKLIKLWINMNKGESAVACSFGKDSMTVLHMAMEVDKNIQVIFNNTGIEFKETLALRDKILKEWKINLHEEHPDISFMAIIKKWGLPKLSRYRHGTPKCCYYLKEVPAKRAYKKLGVKCVFTGITVEESWVRRLSICKRGTAKYSKRWGLTLVHPIAFFTVKDVWRYLHENNIPINEAYQHDERIGCALCPAFKGWQKKVAVHHPKQYRILQERYGNQMLLDSFSFYGNIKKEGDNKLEGKGIREV